MNKRNLGVIAGAAALLVAGSGVGAVAGSLVTSADIKDNTVRSADLKDGKAVGEEDLKPGLVAKVNTAGQPGATGPQGPKGNPGEDGTDGATGPQGPAGADAGVSAAGAGYTDVWAADSYGESIETCAEGEYVTGGGYSMFGGYPTHAGYDLGGENLDIQITVAAPYISGEYVPISETDSRFFADQFVVRGFNHGDTEQVVRAWAECAPIPGN